MESSETAQKAKQQGQQLTRQARQQAGELATRGGEQVKSQLASQKHEASQRLTPIQVALRETAQQLRKQGQAPVAQYADKASDQVERVSGYLRETEVDEMVDEARGFARSRPALFLGGALALGFLGARFLKSSSQEASNGQPVAALPPAEAAPPTARRTPTAGGSVDGADRPVSPRGI
ncbi:hypothetical protein GBA63_15790 [Rubrobacter tropicus]|uniref:DUF3618 domain-containing protein n=1 Tax=Rubrobacter tropicus TaxID=2653851 RepID=A0A6G8QBR3_9ACTN|nr:hypothetical protein [Rubrobacter tropicus]QIN83944.1 hypothetical protein GBA63_15790 [Rubrobacter tropicus]